MFTGGQIVYGNKLAKVNEEVSRLKHPFIRQKAKSSGTNCGEVVSKGRFPLLLGSTQVVVRILDADIILQGQFNTFIQCIGLLGVIPMILGGSGLWMPMGTVICNGTLITMVFILTVLPCSYLLLFRGSTKKRLQAEAQEKNNKRSI